MAVLSMTGYGSASVEVGRRRYRVEARSVNHRFLDLRLRLARELTSLEPALRAAIQAHVTRGRVEVSIDAAPDGSPATVQIDRRLAVEVHDALDELRRELGISEPVGLRDLIAVPGLVGVNRDEPDAPEDDSAIVAGLDEALRALLAMRRTEGAHLEADLRERAARLRAAAAAIAARVPDLTVAFRERITARVADLLGSRAELDPGRLEHEVALYADRCDVSEELTRIAGHLDAFEAELGRTPTGRGKTLDFLAQELNREFNTTGSKVGDAALVHDDIDAQVELERIREQVANLE